MIRARSVVLVAVALGLVGGGVSAASAQTKRVVRTAPMVVPGGSPSLDSPAPLSHERLVRYAGVLGLDADQMKAAETLYSDYTAGVQKQQKKMREVVQRAAEDAQDGDANVFEKKLPEAMRATSQETARLRDQFFSDLKATLRPDQAGNWDRLDRLRRRDNYLARGTLSGSNIDLISVVDALKLSDAQKAPTGETLGQYEVDLDRPLRERETFLTPPGGGADGDGSRSFDGDSIKKYVKDQRDIDAKVQGVNQRFARLLAEEVPSDKRAVFDDLVKQESFKRVYKDPSAARRAKAAQKLADLTPAQRDALAKMLENYGKSAKPVNDRWANAIAKAEAAGQSPNAPFASVTGEKLDPDLVDARKARRDLDNAMKADLEKLLSAEQLAQVQAASQGDGQGVHGKMMVIAAGDGAGGATPIVMHSDEGDDDDEVGVMGGMGGGGPTIITHEVHSTGGGPDEHHVTITQPGTTAPPPGKKP